MGALTLSGYGSGYGDGSGSGYGDGYGYGSGEIVATYAHAVASGYLQPAVVERVATNGGTLAFWRCAASGRPANGGTGPTQAKAGLIEELLGPLAVCTKDALHATVAPWKHRGERLWVVALYGEIQREGDKMGALKRELLVEVLPAFCPPSA